jgi:hypothetical protein
LNGYVYFSNEGSNNVSVVQGASVVGAAGVGTDPQWPTFDSRNGYIYVPNYKSANVSSIEGLRTVGSSATGANPDFALFASGNGGVYVPNYASSTVTVLSIKYETTFLERGLPPGKAWWVNITGNPPAFSNGSSLQTTDPYGSFGFVVSTSDKTYSAMGGTLAVGPANLSQIVNFVRVTYQLTFGNAGLPPGLLWSVVTNNATRSSSSSSQITFSEPNGTYVYSVLSSDLRYSAPTGTYSVYGVPSSVTVQFSEVTYSLTFDEIGLPTGAHWWINVTGSLAADSISSSLMITEPNGTYQYSISTSTKTFAAPSSGSFAVDGANYSRKVSFSPVTYSVVFTGTGLPSATNWSVAIDGSARAWNLAATCSPPSASCEEIAFSLVNGTYSFTITSPSGYAATPSSGSLIVRGANVTRGIAFSSTTPTSMILGLSGSDAAFLIGAIIAAVVVAAWAAILLSRRRKARRHPPELQMSPSERHPPSIQ